MVEAYIHDISVTLDSYFNAKLTTAGVRKFLELHDEYGADEVVVSFYIACEQYDDILTVFTMLPRILANRRKISGYFTKNK